AAANHRDAVAGPGTEKQEVTRVGRVARVGLVDRVGQGDVEAGASAPPVGLGNDDPRRAVLDVHEPHAQFVQTLLEQLTLFGAQVAARLLLEDAEDVDHLARALDIRRLYLARHGIGGSPGLPG